MRHTRIGAVAALLTLASAFQAAAAQPGRGQPPGGGVPRYDVNTVETVRGEVIAVDTVAPGMRGRMAGVHLTLRTGGQTLPVHLGPTTYLAQQSLRVSTGETIEVRGSRVTMGGGPALIAARVTKGQQVVTLRDSTGLPAWRGMGRPMPPRRP
jgi:hypothetical protein